MKSIIGKADVETRKLKEKVFYESEGLFLYYKVSQQLNNEICFRVGMSEVTRIWQFTFTGD